MWTSRPAASPSAKRRLESFIGAKPNGAVFSADRAYRYVLWRKWDSEGPLMVFIGLNPSTADENSDDPTIRRCIGFARGNGAAGLLVTNLFAYRATKPRDLFAASEPVGRDADTWLVASAQVASSTVACWGTHGSHLGRSRQVRSMLGDLLCLGTTMTGEPKHPLYLRGDTKLKKLPREWQ